MKGSWKIAEIAGIGVFLHWTFLILIVWVVGAHVFQGDTMAVAMEGVLFILAVFACIVAHELGHALTARRFGIRTQDITLLPIGGVARLERMPDEPSQELWVALAGPAVNVVIAVGLFVALDLLRGLSAIYSPQLEVVGGDFLAKLMYVNLFLVVFNLLPAFPMDGGRVLRAFLAQWMDYVRATQVAATVGQVMAILFGVWGLLNQQVLIMFIALFVYLGAQQEAHMVQMRSVLRGVPVRNAMITRFRALSENDPLSLVVSELLSGYQTDFPVVEQDRIVGILTRSDLVTALAQRGQEARVGDVMRRDCGSVDAGEMLENTFQRMREGACGSLPVVQDGRLVGMVTLENVGEWMMVQSALGEIKPRSEVEDLFRVG